jgi:hypothetical protein
VSNPRGDAKVLGEAIAPAKAAIEAAHADQAEQLDMLGDQERAVADALPEEETPDQLGLPDAGEILEIQRELQCDVHQAVREHRRRSGAGGRKIGARNKRTAEFRRFLLNQGGHPGVFLQRVQDRPTELLAAELGCSKEKALDKQIRAASELLPYVEGKMPVNVNVAVRGDFSLVAGAGTGLFDGIEDAEFDEDPQLGFHEEKQDDSGDGEGVSE